MPTYNMPEMNESWQRRTLLNPAVPIYAQYAGAYPQQGEAHLVGA